MEPDARAARKTMFLYLSGFQVPTNRVRGGRTGGLGSPRVLEALGSP